MVKGLRLKFGLVVFSLLILWLGLTVYLSIYRSRMIAASDVATESAPVAGVLSVALVPEIEKGDPAGLDSILSGVLSESPKIEYIKVQDNSGAAIKETGAPNPGRDTFITRQIQGQSGPLGSVTVGIRKSTRAQEIKDHFSWFPITAALALERV